MFLSVALEVVVGFVNRIFAILVKELKQLSRDRVTFGMIVMIPLVQLLLFGFAINTDVRHLPAGVVDHSNSSYGRSLMQTVEATQVVDFVQRYHSIAEAEAAITRGDVRAVMVLSPDFVTRLLDYTQSRSSGAQGASPLTSRPVAQWLVDGSDTLITGAIKGLRSMPLDEMFQRSAPTSPPLVFAVVPYFNPEQRNVVNTAPGLLAIILTMTMVMFTATSLVREREQGNIEFLITTPVHPMELMIGKIIPYIFVGLIQTSIVLALSYWVFSVPINGGLVTVFTVTLLFIMASLVLGLLISTRAQTQMQAMQMTFFLMLPSILLSGFMFPYEGMPRAAQIIAEALPATHFVRTIRGVVLRDAGLGDLTFDIIWLSLFAVIGMAIAALRFNKRLD
jgi:ABC-2 type transport system permease protein